MIGVLISDVLCRKPIFDGLFDHPHARLGPCPVISKANKDQNRCIGLKAFIDPAAQRDASRVKGGDGFEAVTFPKIRDFAFSGP